METYKIIREMFDEIKAITKECIETRCNGVDHCGPNCPVANGLCHKRAAYAAADLALDMARIDLAVWVSGNAFDLLTALGAKYDDIKHWIHAPVQDYRTDVGGSAANNFLKNIGAPDRYIK